MPDQFWVTEFLRHSKWDNGIQLVHLVLLIYLSNSALMKVLGFEGTCPAAST